MKDKFFQMRVDDAFLRRLDDVRRAVPEIPSRTEMARRLLDEALDAKLGKHQPRLRAISK